MAYVHSNSADAASLRDRTVALVTSFRAALARRSLYLQTLRELRGLSNRELSDLGLDRHALTKVANMVAYGK